MTMNEEMRKLVNPPSYQKLVDYECVKEVIVFQRKTSRHKEEEKVFKVGTMCKLNPSLNNEEIVFINDGRCKYWFGISRDEFEECFELREQLSLF